MRPSYEVEDSLLRRICRLLVEIVTVIAFAWFIVYSFGTQVVNNGQSMRPTLEDGDRLLLDRFGFKLFGRVGESISLGRDEYFVLSDNLESGEDSRSESIGNVTRKMIRGRIWFRMQPLRSLGHIR